MYSRNFGGIAVGFQIGFVDRKLFGFHFPECWHMEAQEAMRYEIGSYGLK